MRIERRPDFVTLEASSFSFYLHSVLSCSSLFFPLLSLFATLAR